MSLADELTAEATKNKRPSQIDIWLAGWYPTLDKADKAALDSALADPQKSPIQLYRVCKRYGCPGGESGFTKWVKNRRDAR